MMTDDTEARQRIAGLSGSARRLLDYVAVLDGGGRYAVLRHIARATEEDMVVDLQEVVGAGVLATVEGEPNVYDFADEAVRALVLAEIGDVRLPKLRARAEGARRRVEGQSAT
ncbi:MAG: hypothetical protein WBD55_01385 [Dehalococcoidia bacterium]